MVAFGYDNGAVGSLLYSREVPSLLRGLRLSKLYGQQGIITFESNGLFVFVRGKGLPKLLMPGVRRYILPLAFVYGVGLGLFIDEFGLVMNLNPDYFQAENNIAMGVTGAALIALLYRAGRRREPPP